MYLLKDKKPIVLILLFLFLIVPVSATVFTNYTSGALDGFMKQTTNQPWLTMRNGAGEYTDTIATTEVIGFETTSTDQQGDLFLVGYFMFDTSGLPDDATIQSAVVGIPGHALTHTDLGSFSMGIVGFAPATNGTIAAGDYDSRLLFPRYATDIPVASWGIGSYNNYTLNAAGLANVSKIGWTNIALTTNWDIDNDTSQYTWSSSKTSEVVYAASEHGSSPTNGPFIEVTYTTSDVTPPASVTGLTNGTFSACNSTVINWTNPSDADFSHTHIWKDGVIDTEIPNSSHSLTWSGLFGNTTHILSTATVDTSGNVNTTLTNVTFTTPLCAIKSYPKIVLTFDDGYENNLLAAQPILANRGYNATVYVWTGVTGTATHMNATQLLELETLGWDVGNHGYQHVYITTYNVSEQRRIIRQGKENLTAWGLTRAVNHFAWAAGDWNAETISSAASEGVLTARTINISPMYVPNYTHLLKLPITYNALNGNQALATIENVIATANSVNETVILYGHNIVPDDSITTDNWSETKLIGLAGWMYDNGYQVLTISQWYALNEGFATTPVASFTKSRSIVKIPQTVTFTDTSTNTPTSWSWDFGDRSTAVTTQNAAHSYTRAGLYTVTETATNAAGTSTATDRVWVQQPYRLTIGDGFREISYSCDQLSWSISRELSDWEQAQNDEKMMKICMEV